MIQKTTILLLLLVSSSVYAQTDKSYVPPQKLMKAGILIQETIYKNVSTLAEIENDNGWLTLNLEGAIHENGKEVCTYALSQPVSVNKLNIDVACGQLHGVRVLVDPKYHQPQVPTKMDPRGADWTNPDEYWISIAVYKNGNASGKSNAGSFYLSY
ncbi:MAG: hypothetical protein R3A45_03125 [Bdellovibrionota bacterium]